jgi:predicted metal-dependent phosphotriesterase family hydrolase
MQAIAPKHFDMTRAIHSLCEETILRYSGLNDSMVAIELSGQVFNTETLPFLQAMIGDENRIKKVLALYLDHIIRTQGGTKADIKVHLTVYSQETAETLQSLFASKQAVLCQVQLGSAHKFDCLQESLDTVEELKLALAEKLL